MLHRSAYLLVPLAIWASSFATAQTVTLDSATVQGTSSGSTVSFLGIPFAQPPTGSLRFALPQANSPYTGTIDATSYGPACPQQEIELPDLSGLVADAANWVVNSVYDAILPDDEDCLTINVIAPSSASPGDNLPVLVWIFGGGFEIGGPSLYDGTNIVEQSISLELPVVYVSMNYRLNAFGFLGGEEVQAAGVGNLGLQDQRQALRWVQQYISAFGGDPTKVTIWGESAGAISVSLHMLTNGGNTEGLFRAGFMESGSPIPVGSITNGQPYYNALVDAAGCSGSSDTLSCLRTVPYATLKSAMNQSPGLFAYQSLNLAWIPSADGVFLTDSPQQLVLQGSVADIPFITGDCDDEGTLFALASLNVTTDSQFSDYIQNTILGGSATSADMDQLASLYPSDPTQGSPFNTWLLNAITPQFKRIAAFLGDGVFQGPRRFFLQQQSGKQNTWSFLSKREKILPVVGSAHTTDLLNVFYGGEMGDYLIYFTNNLNPNGVHINWPQYTAKSPQLMTFLDGLFPLEITQDTYRADAIAFVTNLTLANPI